MLTNSIKNGHVSSIASFLLDTPVFNMADTKTIRTITLGIELTRDASQWRHEISNAVSFLRRAKEIFVEEGCLSLYNSDQIESTLFMRALTSPTTISSSSSSLQRLCCANYTNNNK